MRGVTIRSSKSVPKRLRTSLIPYCVGITGIYVWTGSVLADSRAKNKCCMQQMRYMISVLHVPHWQADLWSIDSSNMIGGWPGQTLTSAKTGGPITV